MFKLKQVEVFKICANIFEKFEDKLNRTEMVAKFIAAGVPIATAYRQYAILMLGVTNRKPGAGLSRSKLNSVTEKKSNNLVENKVFCGYAAIGRAISVNEKTAKYSIKKLDINVQKRKKFKDLSNVPDEVRFRQKSKFGLKLMVWIAIGANGHCQPYFHPTKGALNANLYAKECLTKRLIPWIKKSYNNQNVLFWPDLVHVLGLPSPLKIE